MNKKETLEEKLKIIKDINDSKDKVKAMIESQKKHKDGLDEKIIKVRKEKIN